jgi:hypothetical protein
MAEAAFDGDQLAESNEPQPQMFCAARWLPGLRLAEQTKGIAVAQTFGEVLEIGRQRYSRFVVDQRQPYKPISPNVLALIDDIDRLSINFYRRQNAEITMAIRMSWLNDIRPTDYLWPLQSHLAKDVLNSRTIVVSRLIAALGAIDLVGLLPLFRLAYETGLQSNCRYSVVSALPERVPLFSRLGYRPTTSLLHDKIAGDQSIMLLDLLDFEHLEVIRSPLYKVAKKYERGGSVLLASRNSKLAALAV